MQKRDYLISKVIFVVVFRRKKQFRIFSGESLEVLHCFEN